MQRGELYLVTNGFSKKVDNHIAAVSLRFMYYNFVRIHQTLKVTPAMAAGVTDRLWEISDIVALLDGIAEQPATLNLPQSVFRRPGPRNYRG